MTSGIVESCKHYRGVLYLVPFRDKDGEWSQPQCVVCQRCDSIHFFPRERERGVQPPEAA